MLDAICYSPPPPLRAVQCNKLELTDVSMIIYKAKWTGAMN